MLNALLLGAALIVVVMLLLPTVRDARLWRATVTPLASIIGSGFLIAGPLLTHVVGASAPIAMFAILLVAFGIGAIIRFNIAHGEALLARADCPVALSSAQRASDLALSLAYVVSVAFYVRLLASFVVRFGSLRDAAIENALTTAVLLSIAAVGWFRGLSGLERTEEFAVATKIAIIAALLLGLSSFDFAWLAAGESLVDTSPDLPIVERLRLLAGLLLIVQGFETSRYLGASYDASLRIKSMRLAQILAGAIYLLFILLGLPLLVEFHGSADETAIITLAERVAVVLPGMIVVAAAMSQFSAAVADTVGAGGLLNELSRGKIPTRNSYVWLILSAIVLVWTANVFEIVTLASRAFAIYYLLQCLVAIGTCVKVKTESTERYVLIPAMALMATLLLAVAVFAIPAG